MMILLLFLMATGLTLCAVVSLAVLLQLQTRWMKAFGEQQGVNLSTDDKPQLEVDAPPIKKEKHRITIPIPGADMIRQMRVPKP
jgi:hypothetical protein